MNTTTLGKIIDSVVEQKFKNPSYPLITTNNSTNSVAINKNNDVQRNWNLRSLYNNKSDQINSNKYNTYKRNN
ncbi:hypothetical protein [Lonomia obliqua multiple nucleopolyhedrovirus]|uniref:Uncharacterized protein n=1 Tax=Lonomia obliqua multiple nucleopolyhedrovirus TaxID=134394 RepID=A0A126FCC8_9ABAC|nr:hypothetical protein [Lonomia obliqua multiple nucleopolyhedrovirus]AKN81056.1 hypothetical protein [Lonomia obliqua multiple nucleopolyhedrovirus]